VQTIALVVMVSYSCCVKIVCRNACALLCTLGPEPKKLRPAYLCVVY
jgi:hypothetical protein